MIVPMTSTVAIPGSTPAAKCASLRLLRRAVSLWVCVGVIAPRTHAQDETASPQAAYQALVATYRVDSGSFRRAGTDEERRAAVEQLAQYALRFADLAERHAADPIALDAAREVVNALNSVDSLTMLAWETNTSAFPERDEKDPVGRAIALLRRDHLRSERLGAVCVRMSYGVRPEYETFLRAVVSENPHAEVQGLACLSLAQFLHGRLLRVDLAVGRPEFTERYALLLGRECFEELRTRDRARAGEEVEAWIERAAAREYGEVAHPSAGTVGARARSELFELRHLAAGKLAPEIEGMDQDGKALRLSEQRGKVVLLDFWHEL